MAIMRLSRIPQRFVARINIKQTLIDAISADPRSAYSQNTYGEWFRTLADTGMNVPVSDPDTDIAEQISILNNAQLVIENAPEDIFEVTLHVRIKGGHMYFDLIRALKQVASKPGCNEMTANALIRYSDLMEAEHPRKE